MSKLTESIIESAKTDLMKQSESAAQHALAVVVNDDDSYELAGRVQANLKALRDKVRAWFEPHVERTHAAHKALTAERKAVLDPIESALNKTAMAMGSYKMEMERQRREEESILRKKAAADAAKENELRAAEAEFMGDASTAQALREVAPQVARLAGELVTVENLTPTIAGSRSRADWKFEITDGAKVPREFLTPDLKAIGAFVRARKEAAAIPGVRTWCDHKVNV